MDLAGIIYSVLQGEAMLITGGGCFNLGECLRTANN